MMTGQAWIKNGFRVIFSARIIARGKDKGKCEVQYKRGSKIKKAIVPASCVRVMPKGE